MSYDFSSLLSLDNVRDGGITKIIRTSLYPDGEVTILYQDLPYGTLADASSWLTDNRLTIKDASVAGQSLEGVWRTVSIQEEAVIDRAGAKNGVVLAQKMAKGLYDVLDWNAVRSAQESSTLGTTQAVTGISSIVGDLYQEETTLVMPYVRHESAHAISKALIASASVTDLVYARTVKLAGVWFVLSATPKLQEDQTCSIYITLAKSRFVVEQYSGHSARDGVSSFRVYNVPVSQAQGVINAWKTVDGTVGGVARKGANGSIESYSGDRCNIELSISVENAESNSKVAYRTDYFKSSVSTDNSNQTSALAHPAFSAGKIITTANAKTKLGNYDTSNDEDAAIKREWTDTYPTRDGTVSVYQGRNLTSAELVIAKAAFGMTTALDNRWSASPNEFGLWDYSLIIPPSPGNGQLGWVPCETTWNYYEEQFNKDATRFRLLRYTMGLKQSADLSAITTWLGTNGGVNSVEPLNSGWKSRFKRFEDAGAWQTVGGT